MTETINHKQEKQPHPPIKTAVYPESDKSVRLHDQQNGIGVGDNLVGRLKEGLVDKGVYMIPDHKGNESAMVLTGRIELNEQPSFDDRNQPTTDRLVEVASYAPQSLDSNNEATYLHKWVREEDLAHFERLHMEDGASDQNEMTHVPVEWKTEQEDIPVRYGEQLSEQDRRSVGDKAIKLVGGQLEPNHTASSGDTTKR